MTNWVCKLIHPLIHLKSNDSLQATIAKPNGNDVPEGAPNVEAALSVDPANVQAARKPTIGQRKTQAKGKLGSKLGAKKAGGLGAQKVKKDFSEIEREAEMADLGRTKAAEEAKEALKATEEDEAKQAASMRLAYQDLSLEQKKTEEKMQKVDPKKAKQVERLGMGVTKKGGFSHSMITEIATIDQEEPSSGRSANRVDEFSSRPKSKFEDDFEFIGGSGLSSSNNNRIESSWEKEFEVMKSSSKITSQPKDNWSNDFDQDVPKRSGGFDSRPKRPETLSTSSASFDAKKYGGAKAISSDMLFGQDQNVSSSNFSRQILPLHIQDFSKFFSSKWTTAFYEFLQQNSKAIFSSNRTTTFSRVFQIFLVKLNRYIFTSFYNKILQLFSRHIEPLHFYDFLQSILTLIFQSGQDANLSRFQGSSSISSAEYFNRQETTYAAGRGMQTPDMEDVKESVRQGVTKVAGRLSNLASGAMSQLQVRNRSHFVLQFF